MYNRYIPQPDGTYRRDTVRTSEPPRQSRQFTNNSCEQQSPPPPPPQIPQPQTQPQQHQRQRESKRPQKVTPSTPPADSIPSFLKQLLPRDLDTGDLLVIILLLLMAGDCREDRNHALLTLVLYLFL